MRWRKWYLLNMACMLRRIEMIIGSDSIEMVVVVVGRWRMNDYQVGPLKLPVYFGRSGSGRSGGGPGQGGYCGCEGP